MRPASSSFLLVQSSQPFKSLAVFVIFCCYLLFLNTMHIFCISVHLNFMIPDSTNKPVTDSGELLLLCAQIHLQITSWANIKKKNRQRPCQPFSSYLYSREALLSAVLHWPSAAFGQIAGSVLSLRLDEDLQFLPLTLLWVLHQKSSSFLFSCLRIIRTETKTTKVTLNSNIFWQFYFSSCTLTGITLLALLWNKQRTPGSCFNRLGPSPLFVHTPWCSEQCRVNKPSINQAYSIPRS